MAKASTATYALLGLLAVKPWTGYELTQQVRRSLRFAWPSSEAHLYREQKGLVELGWATVEKQTTGGRSRNLYSITQEGRSALREWMRSDPAAPRLEVEGILRAFFGDQGEPDDLARSLRTTSASARDVVEELNSFAADYLETGGPFPKRLHVIAVAAGLIVDVMSHIANYCDAAATEVDGWETTEGLGMTEATRHRFESMLELSNDRPLDTTTSRDI